MKNQVWMWTTVLLACATAWAGAAEGLPPYRLSQLTAYPATAVTTGPITVDGDLKEWRADAFVAIFLDPTARETRGCRLALAYTDAGLYVAMDVNDDTPLHNVIDPIADPFRGWRGDAMQMRFIPPSNLISHWTWWYFTERQLPAVDVRYGQDFSNPVTLTGPAAQLQYRRRAGGYTFELLMPWKLFRVDGPGGGKWRTTLEPHWSVFGDEVAAFSECVTREENAMYQRPQYWGELRFATPKDAVSLLAEQQATEQKRARLGRETAEGWGRPLKVTTPAAGFVSLAIADGSGKNVRTLLASARRPQGEFTEYWDGLDDDGKPVPAGTYRLKALTHPGIKPKFVTSVMNSGTPPWITADGKGSWGGDHGNPIAAAAGPDGGTFLLWSAGEAGFSMIGVDANGKKQWGYKLPFGHHFTVLAHDNGLVYVAEPGALWVHNARTGANAAFPDGRATVPVGDWPGAGDQIAGLAAGPTALYVALAKPGKVVAVDKKTLKPINSWDVPQAGHLAYDAARKRLYAVGDGQVWVIEPDGKTAAKPFIKTGLESPTGLGVDGLGNVYVAQQGSRMCVAVFTSRGAAVSTIGKVGGRPTVGRYDPNGLLRPAGICVDARGRLWVTENDNMPRRISVWDTRTGRFLREFFGGAAYAVMMAADPEKPEHVYLHNCRFIVDYDKGTSRPDATVYRPGARGSTVPGSEAGYGFMGATFTISRYQGRTFAYNGHGGVFAHGADEFTPLLTRPGANNIFQFGGTFFPGATFIKDRQVYRPDGLTPDGAPHYPAPTPILTGSGPMAQYSNWMDVWPSREQAGKEFYAIASLPDTKYGGIPDGGGGDGLFRFKPNGEILWRYPRMKVFYAIKDQRLAGPGDLMGALRITGLVQMPTEKGGEIVGVGCYRGYYGLVSGDGLFIDKISDDKGKGLPPNFDTFFIENFSGYLFKHPRTGKVYLFCGDVDARILELRGFENIKCFDGGTFALPEAEVARLTQARAHAQSGQPVAATDLTVVQVATAPGEAAFPARALRRIDLDEGRSATVGLCRDAVNLYALYRVDDPSPWINGATEWKMLFKGGDAVDLQLAAAAGPAAVRVFVAPSAPAGGFVAVGMWPTALQGMTASPETYTSPVGAETFGRVAKLEKVTVTVTKRADGYTALVTIPWTELGLTPPAAGVTWRGDMGVLFSDPSGSRTIRRRYLFNTETAIVDDIPSEVRLRPEAWKPVKCE